MRRCRAFRQGGVGDVMMDFRRGFPDQEQAARNENQIAPRKPMPECFEERVREPDNDCYCAEQGKPHSERKRNAEPLSPCAL